jgi:flagellar basal-body rod modification protein FlgD
VGFRLGANAAKVVVSIFNSAGQMVRRIDAGALSAGDQSLIWDGKDSAGNTAQPGAYGFNVSAFDVNGNQISAAGNLRGVVTGVKLDGTEPVLEVGGLDVPLSGVTTVRAVR